MSAPGPGPGESLGFQLWRVTLGWQRRITAALQPLELTHVQFVLLASVWWLDDHPPRERAPHQRDVAEHAGVDVMMTSQVLRTLERRGLVTRTTDPADARVKRLGISSAGRGLAERAVAVVEAVDRAYFRPAGDPEQVLAVLRRLAGADPAPSGPPARAQVR